MDLRAMELEMGSHPILIIHFLVDDQFCHVNLITRGLLHVKLLFDDFRPFFGWFHITHHL